MYRKRKGTCAAGGLSTVELLLLSCSAETVYCAKKEDPWKPSAAAFQVMEELAKEAQDFSLLRLLHVYKKFPAPFIARIFCQGIAQE